MNKLLSVGLTLPLGAAFLSGCGQSKGETPLTTSGAVGVSQTAEEIVIPDTCTAIGKDAFFQADMKSIVIGSSVEEIGDSAFWECNNFESISFPSSVPPTEKNAFNKCDKLKTITFPESLTTIGEGIFAPCSAMTDVYIPASMENIPMGALRLAFNFGTKIFVKEGSWAVLNFKSSFPRIRTVRRTHTTRKHIINFCGEE